MEYNINPEVWKSVFAVPGTIVDDNIKLSGAAQLKVLLWVLRHWGEDFGIEDISKALGIQSADVKDCMQYWCELGVMQTGETSKKAEQTVKEETDNTAKNNKVVVLKPEKPDSKHIAEMIISDKNVAYMMNFAEGIYGRLLSNNDKSTLLFIHEYYSMPIEVIVMMLEYLSGAGKCSTKYIEQMAADWWRKGISTLESAEKQIQYLTEIETNVHKLLVILGQSGRPATKEEISLADLWFGEWKMSEEMIKEAYETSINNTGKFSYNYMKKVVQSWHENGITNLEQVKKQEKNYKKSKSGSDSYKPTYDIAAYESSSLLDSEEWN